MTGANASVDKQRGDRVFLADAADGFRQQLGNRQLSDAGTLLCGLGQRDGI